jgi:7,8-dihydroneopterin aldolase/epimerase/oxygenase
VTPLGGDPAGDVGGGAGNRDRIQLGALRVIGIHGVLPEERERAQPFELDLDLTVDLALAGVTDRLSDTVDYGAVAARAAAVVSEGSFELLEALAGAVAEQVLALDVRITAVTVHLRKLRPPVPLDLGTVGVRITRRQ